MVKGLREKFRKNGGFTLVEMLIVVAIIAILIAVSIPLVSSALEKARIATDTANERSAIGLAEIGYLAGNVTPGTTYHYVITNASGSLEADDTKVVAYGQCKKHQGGHITVSVNADGVATCAWTGGTDTDTDFKITATVKPAGS